MDLINNYLMIYGIEVFASEDNTIMVNLDGETHAVTGEFLRSMQRRGIYWDMRIDECGDVISMPVAPVVRTLMDRYREQGRSRLDRTAFIDDASYVDYLFEVSESINVEHVSDESEDEDEDEGDGMEFEEGDAGVDEL